MTQIIPSKGGGGGGSGATYTAGTGIDISAQNEISIDTDVVQTVGNMVDNLTGADDDHYPTAKAVADAISGGGLGDVIGPASSTDEDVAVFDGATGKIIKDSGVKLSSKLDASALSDNNYGGAWENDSTHTPTKRVLYDKIHTMDVEIGNKAADNTVVKLTGNQTIAGTKTFSTSPIVPSKTSSATNTGTSIATEAQVYSVKTAVDTINGKIPSAATSSNKLADKAYVDDSINSVTAYYITKNAQGDQWASYAELANAKYFYSGGTLREPTRNDYTIVLNDETHDHATTRYIFNKDWEYQYTVNETAMTQAQLDALNSGITSAKVSTYDGYASSKQDVSNLKTSLSDNSDTYYPSQKAVKTAVDKKQDKLVAGTDISIVNPIVPDGYTQLTYLGADGQISLGFRTTNNSRIEASWTKNKNANKFLYQSDSGSSLTTNTTAYSTTGNANWRFGNRYISIDTSDLKDYLTIQDSSGVTVNGTTYAYSTVNTFTSTNYFKVLYTGDEDIIRLKYLKHYSSNVLTLHIVPAMRNSDNAYGFYDVVSDTFFTDNTLTYDVGEAVYPEISFNNNSGYALDSDVVHNTGDETVAGAKTFTSGIEVQVNSDAGLNIKSNSAGGYLYVTRGSGGSQVQSEIKSVSSGGAFGTATNHALMLRTNDTTQVTVGTDGSMVLNTDVASNSNNNQVATTKWTNSKLGDYLAKANITAFTPSGDYNPATKKYVDDSVANLMAMGKFLSLWDCTTGQPISFPLSTPYTYHTGDYFMVEVVSSATPPVNYRPNGSSYTGTASSTAETDEVAKGDFYVYDGSVWLLASNHGKEVSFANIAGNPSDNQALNSELNTKTFYLTGTTGQSNLDTAQAALDWYLAGKNPIIVYSKKDYQLSSNDANGIKFSGEVFYYGKMADGYSEIKQRYIYFVKTSGNISSIILGSDLISVLGVGVNYTTPYTPQYPGSPATKKYVDDNATVVSGDTGVTYTIKVSNSDPTSGTASNIITLVP